MDNIYKTLDVIVKAQKKARQSNDYLTLMTNAEALLEYIPELINHSVNKEAEYRKFEAGLSTKTETDGKRLTSSYCETQAKATEFYQEWQRAKQFIELMYEMVNMSKALGRGINKEFNAS